MNELFRFLLIRPADVVASEDTKQLAASFAPTGTPRDVARREAQAFIDSKSNATFADRLKYGAAALGLVSKLRQGPQPLSDLSEAVTQATGSTPDQVVSDPTFVTEEKLVADSLVAMKLLSDSSGADAAGLAEVALGYDAIRLAAGGQDPVRLRVLSVGDFPAADGGSTPTPGAPPTSASPTMDPATFSRTIGQLDNAIKALGALSASSFDVGAAPSFTKEHRVGTHPPTTTGGGKGAPLWLLSSDAISNLPSDVRDTLANWRLDPNKQSMPAILATLHAAIVEQQIRLAEATIPVFSTFYKFGTAFAPISSNDYVGDPSQGVPSGHGSIRPTGIGDLLMVKEHILRYEGGDLAHVENVMKSERFERDTRRLERTETTVLQETETTKEETRDTQTTDRFSLKRETSDTIKNDSTVKAGLSVDAKYGPFVEVKANADYATSTSTESSVKQASEFSKDVVDRSISKLVERVLERRTVTTITEFEEKYAHVFDNTAGSGHISGYYQWLDKVLQAQVYNYGKRLLFDITVPEPGTNYILSQSQATDAAQTLQKPPEFTALASDMNEGSYLIWAKRYDATGLEPPPAPFKTYVKNIHAELNGDPWDTGGSESFTIDDGYRAKYVRFSTDYWAHDLSHAWWSLLVGSNRMQVIAAFVPYMDMAGEEVSVAFAYDAHELELLAANVEIYCERTEQAYSAWQLKIHAGITQAYLAKEQAYEQALAQAKADAGTVIAGRNPDFNQRIVSTELRRQSLTLITAQQFDAFGALELSAEGYAQPNLVRTGEQMPYVRFFEQAFEWEHLVYFFYPYFWGWKKAWKNRMLIDDVDPAFGDFLRAGAARVVFPVRPGFEAAVVHYIETGEIWNGGPPPDISSSLYVPIVKEIQEATGAPGNEQSVGDPWEVHLPTTLVRLRPNNDLPEWQKVAESWQAIN